MILAWRTINKGEPIVNDLQVIEGADSEGQSALAIATSRSAQEIQGMIAVAQARPRDERRAITRIVEAMKRPTLAEQAVYKYPRGGTNVEGPSIRTAETMARYWGNLDCGVIELEQDRFRGESICMAFAWDLETNTRVSKTFTVRHERSKKSGNVALTDPRDIYELVANNGARRLRACILAIIPQDVAEMAVEQSRKTLAGQSNEPLKARITKMVIAFGEFDVSEEMIQRRIGHSLDAMSEHQLADLRKVFTSLKDGMGKVEDFFSREAPKKPAEKTSDEDFAGAAKAKAAEKKTAKAKENEPPADGDLFDKGHPEHND